jgi:exopolysaccharide biosynthesis polyprenyl glycosylphosphotransferase
MNQNHKRSNELLMGGLSPYIDAKQKENIVGEVASGARRTNIRRTEEGFNQAIPVAYPEDTPRWAPRKIRVLLVITGLASGGATNVVLDLARYFHNHPDFDVHLLTGPIPPGRTDVTYLAYELGINTRVIPSLVNHINPIVNMKAVAAVQRIIVQGNYDIVHTHSSVAGVVGRLAALAAGVPVVIHHVHGWALHQDMPISMRMLYVTLERLCARYTTRIVTVSRPDIQKGLAHHIGREDKFALIYNGIDLEKFRQPVNDKQLREELGLDPDCKLVGMIGRLDRQKNPLDFIRAAAIVASSYSKVQFLLVGDGPLRPESEHLINELNLKEKFFLLGYRSDVPRIMSILTITAMSSLWEGLPLAFLEAMSAGKPIVANDVDGANDVVIDGETGFLVPPHQPSEMAERILYLLNNEPLCHEMGYVARRRSGYFSIERMVGQIESLYKELCPVHINSKSFNNGYRDYRVEKKTMNIGVTNQVIPFIGLKNKISAFKNRIIDKYQSFAVPFSERKVLLVMGDAFIVLLAVLGAFSLWHQTANTDLDIVTHMRDRWYWFPILLNGWWVLAWLNDLYHVPSSLDKIANARRVATVSAINLVIYMAIVLQAPLELPHTFFLYFWLIVWLAITLWRWMYATLFSISPFRRRVLIVGNGKRGKSIAKLLEQDSNLNYHVLGYVDDLAESRTEGDDRSILGQVKDLPRLVQELRVHEVVLAIEQNLQPDLFELLVECQANGVRVSSISDLYDKVLHKIPVEYINPDWAMYMIKDRAVFDRLPLGLKRLLDLVFAGAGLLLFIPFLPLIALAIRLDSVGPIFYRQIRIGRGGKPFSIIKFRTMVTNAEEDGKPRWATKDDLRITRVGRLLRKTRLDEVPQLLNVLRGEMSLVGPRPERPEFIQQLQREIPFYRTRLMVKPGLTGWAQVRYNYGNTLEDAQIKLQYDFYYLHHWSLWLDLYIIFQTIGVVLKFKGT